MQRKFLLYFLTLCLIFATGVSWADEASYFDPRYGWLIRAYTDHDDVMIEVRSTSNQPVTNVLINGNTNNPHTIVQNSSVPPHNISLAFDEATGKAYVFYTNQGGLQLATVNIASSIGNISANPSSVNFGSVTIGQTKDETVTVTNTGSAPVTLGSISVTGNGFSRHGGTCTNDQQLLAFASCTVIVGFAPSAAVGFSGTLSIPSNANSLSIPLSGTGVQQGSNVDLTITSIAAPKSADNGVSFSITVTIKNNGTAAAEQFSVKAYFSVDQIPNNVGSPQDQLLTTWNVNSLGAGASQTLTGSGRFSGFPIHNSYFIVVKVDSDDQIAESDEGNNVRTQAVFVSR